MHGILDFNQQVEPVLSPPQFLSMNNLYMHLKDVAAHTAHRVSGNANERTQAIYDSIDPPNELRNRIHLRNLALVHVALIISLMQRVAGSTVTNDRHHGARGGMYGAYEHYAQPYPVTNP